MRAGYRLTIGAAINAVITDASATAAEDLQHLFWAHGNAVLPLAFEFCAVLRLNFLFGHGRATVRLPRGINAGEERQEFGLRRTLAPVLKKLNGFRKRHFGDFGRKLFQPRRKSSDDRRPIYAVSGGASPDGVSVLRAYPANSMI